MDISELVKLLGIIVVIVGFTLKLDSILTILIAAVTTAVIAGMDPIVFLQTLGKSFVSTRTMLICVVVFVLTGTLEACQGCKRRHHYGSLRCLPRHFCCIQRWLWRRCRIH